MICERWLDRDLRRRSSVAVCIAAFLLLAFTERDGRAQPIEPGEPMTYLRVELGVNSPAGILAITIGRAPSPAFDLQGSVGLGTGSVFLSGTARYSLANWEAWRFSAGVGASFGKSHGGGCCATEDEEPPPPGTFWLHQELGFERLTPRGLALLVAGGLEELVAGKYHVDMGDLNLIDRSAGSVAPYLRVGIGGAF